MSTETHVVLCVLEGPIPDGRVYSELRSHELQIIVDATDHWLDGLIDTKREIQEDEQEAHQEYIDEVAVTLEKIRAFNN